LLVVVVIQRRAERRGSYHGDGQEQTQKTSHRDVCGAAVVYVYACVIRWTAVVCLMSDRSCPMVL
jgi:hypothetical protein